MNRIIFSFLILIFSVTATAAVSVQKKYSDYGTACIDFQIFITDEISLQDVNGLKKSIAQIQKTAIDAPCDSGKLAVWLDSNGGDPFAAIEMGRIIRNNEVHVVVERSKKCISSCVFLFAGGVIRVAGNDQIGIHRPYFKNLSAGLSSKDVRDKREVLNGEILKYFKEVDVSPTLLERMLGIEPERVEFLSRAELSRYRLSLEDATYNERKTARDADEYGLTSHQYRERFEVVKDKCANLALSSHDKWKICNLSIMLQISITEAAARDKLASLSCIERKEVKAIKACRRSVYITGKLK
jgi:hypothetical protein